MGIKELLQEQGKIYSNLPSNEIIEECNEKIEKPKPVKLVPYYNFQLEEQEHKAMKGLEKLLGGCTPEILVNNNQITYLGINNKGLAYIPEQINNLPNLQILYLYSNQITKLENLDNLPNLQRLWLDSNQITKLENLDNLPNLQILYLSSNQISKLENLDNLPNLQRLDLYSNQISKLENLDNLPNLQKLDLDSNQIQKLENLDNLPNLKELYLYNNPIKNKEEIKKLKDRGVDAHI